MVYSALRTPGGIEVLAEEDGWAVEDGYRIALVGAHDADVGAMFAQLRRMVRVAIGRQYLERATHRDGWIMRGMDLEGRLVWRDERPEYDVVVDGKRLSWEEFGAPVLLQARPRLALRTFTSSVPRPAQADSTSW
jgi:hypothetical protein